LSPVENARLELEEKTGSKVVTSNNYVPPGNKLRDKRQKTEHQKS
jgi:hypothetical protein